MMIVNYDGFTAASTIIHSSQGAALLLLGAAEAYSLDNPGSKIGFAGPLALLAAAAAIPLAVLALPGGGSFEGLKAALAARRGFFLFISLSCLLGAAGFSRLTQLALWRRAGGWQALFLFFLAGCGVLYFLLPWRVNPEAWRRTLPWHFAMGTTLLLAVALKAAYTFSGRRRLHMAWAVLLVATALQLLTFRETEGAYGLRMVTLETAPALPENVPAINKKRPAH
jgi:hypothetical protein